MEINMVQRRSPLRRIRHATARRRNLVHSRARDAGPRQQQNIEPPTERLMQKLIRRINLRDVEGEEARTLLAQEWLVTNGLGGYASGTISGAVSWRYHGLLIAALPSPLGRVVMLNHLAESLRLPDGRVLEFCGQEANPRDRMMSCGHFLVEFRLENQMPIWRYEMDHIVVEKTLVLLHGQNTVHVTYRLLSGPESLQLELRPSMHF